MPMLFSCELLSFGVPLLDVYVNKGTLEFTSERMGGTMTRLEKLVKIPRYFDFDSLGYLLGNTCAGYTP
jgi:hypothetical protein